MVTTFAGSGTAGAANGNGLSASFSYPMGSYLNPNDECLYVCDNNQTIRKITMQGNGLIFCRFKKKESDCIPTLEETSRIKLLCTNLIFLIWKDGNLKTEIWTYYNSPDVVPEVETRKMQKKMDNRNFMKFAFQELYC